jgi:hypothetical protein
MQLRVSVAAAIASVPPDRAPSVLLLGEQGFSAVTAASNSLRTVRRRVCTEGLIRYACDNSAQMHGSHA